MLAMSRSPVAVARTAYDAAKKSLPQFAHKKSPRIYTQWQIVAMLVVRQFLGMDYRDFVATLADWSDLKNALELKRVPHYSTLCVAEGRLGEKNFRLC